MATAMAETQQVCAARDRFPPRLRLSRAGPGDAPDVGLLTGGIQPRISLVPGPPVSMLDQLDHLIKR